MCWQLFHWNNPFTFIQIQLSPLSVFGSCQESINTVCGALAKSVFCGAAGASPVPPLALVAGSSWRPWISNNCSNQEASKASSSRTWGNREKKSWFYIRGLHIFLGGPYKLTATLVYVLKTNMDQEWFETPASWNHMMNLYAMCNPWKDNIYLDFNEKVIPIPTSLLFSFVPQIENKFQKKPICS